MSTKPLKMKGTCSFNVHEDEVKTLLLLVRHCAAVTLSNEPHAVFNNGGMCTRSTGSAMNAADTKGRGVMREC